MNNKSKTKELAENLIYATFKLLKENNNKMERTDIIEKIPYTIKLDDYANYIFEKTHYIRWQSILQFYTIGCVKVGFLIKRDGIWYLTKEGEEIFKQGKEKIIIEIDKKYKEWNKNKQENNVEQQLEEKTLEFEKNNKEFVLEDIESTLKNYIYDFINSLNPYKFQDLCGALLRGMGYYTTFIAPTGKDGGIDIIAYKDPIGASYPRIKVQVKHRNNKATAQEVRELSGILKSDDMGVFISTGGFTPDAEKEVKIRNNHIEFIDLERFVSLWIEFFNKMSDEDKNLMFIKAIYCLKDNK